MPICFLAPRRIAFAIALKQKKRSKRASERASKRARAREREREREREEGAAACPFLALPPLANRSRPAATAAAAPSRLPFSFASAIEFVVKLSEAEAEGQK